MLILLNSKDFILHRKGHLEKDYRIKGENQFALFFSMTHCRKSALHHPVLHLMPPSVFSSRCSCTQCTFVPRDTKLHSSLAKIGIWGKNALFSFLEWVTLLNFMHSKSIHVFPSNSKILFSFRVEKYFRYIPDFIIY